MQIITFIILSCDNARRYIVSDVDNMHYRYLFPLSISIVRRYIVS